MSHARAHSKFSASGAERRFNCVFSIDHEESSPPSQDSEASKEGTKAHAILETLFGIHAHDSFKGIRARLELTGDDFIQHAMLMVNEVLRIKSTLVQPELLIEKRVHNFSLHPEMFGTVDAGLVEIYGTLHVFDYKYGKHVVKAEKNLQLLQYALGLAETYDWEFTDVVIHVMQPRAGKNWHKQWAITMEELRGYWYPLFESNIRRYKKGGNKPFKGSHCFFCRGKATCPAHVEARQEKRLNAFEAEGRQNGFEEESESYEEDF